MHLQESKREQKQTSQVCSLVEVKALSCQTNPTHRRVEETSASFPPAHQRSPFLCTWRLQNPAPGVYIFHRSSTDWVWGCYCCWHALPDSHHRHLAQPASARFPSSRLPSASAPGFPAPPHPRFQRPGPPRSPPGQRARQAVTCTDSQTPLWSPDYKRFYFSLTLFQI